MSAYPSIRPCEHCRRLTRPSKHKPNQYPFHTVVRANGRLCSRCADEVNRRGPAPADDSRTAHNLNALLAWTAQRRERIARSKQAPMA